MKPVIFTLTYCPNCNKLKATLRAAGVEFDDPRFGVGSIGKGLVVVCSPVRGEETGISV